MSEQEIMAGNTESTDDSSQKLNSQETQQAKTYTEEEFNQHMAGLKASLTKKLLKPYEDLGDPEELRQLRQEAEKRQQEQQIKRGEFEKTLQELAAKKDQEIQKRDSVIREYKIDTPLLTAASKMKAVAPEQVKALLKNNINLNENGEVTVLDDKGQVRYTDDGTALTVDDFVKEFLDTNPHFVGATPSTTSTKTNIAPGKSGDIDINKLDMTNPQHRQLYADARKAGRIK